MPFNIGGVELALILVIVAMLFGLGKLPEVFGAVGKGIKEFRKEAGADGKSLATSQVDQPVESDSEAKPIQE